MIAVPEAVLLPSSPRPAAARSASVIAGGKPCGKVGIASSVTSPAISQCPVMVSLPAEASRIAPQAPRGAATAGTPAIVRKVAEAERFEIRQRQPADRAREVPERVGSRVAVSRRVGRAPQPTPSATRMMARRKAGTS